MTENFNILVNKLNSFRRKYYLFRLMRGTALSLFMILIVFTAVSVIEYFGYLPGETRKFLFYGLIVFGILLLVRFVLTPALRMMNILKTIDNRSSGEMIQYQISEIKDKLVNVIELAELKENNYSDEIILASIDQKIEQLKLFDFNKAIRFDDVKNVLYFLVAGLLVSVSIFIVDKRIYSESANRLVHYNTTFEKPAPFSFNLLNQSLKVKKGESFTIRVKIEGEELPQLLYVNIGGNNYLMNKKEVDLFEYEMLSVINPVKFYLTDSKYRSGSYSIELLPKPGITGFTTSVFPPAYTGLQHNVYENVGDLQVPAGTRIEWNFSGIDVDTVFLTFNDSVKHTVENTDNLFKFGSNIYESTAYNVYMQNKITQPELALSYAIEVVPDLFPEIKVLQFEDSLQLTRFFFKGIIHDDYGFTKLQFHYNVNDIDSAIPIPFVRTLNDQDFYFHFDFKNLEKTDKIISYYFSVTDNDAINRYKTTTSDNFTFKFPDREEILAADKEKFDLIQQRIDESRKLAGEIQRDLENLQVKNMDTNISDWEKSQLVNDIISKQNRLEKLYEQIKQDNENLNNYLNSFSRQNEEIVEKQKQIEELLDEVFTDELKKLMEEFNKLAEEFNSRKLNQLSDQMKLTYEDLQKQLDRNLEMLRKMKIEQQLQDVIEEIKTLAEEENQLSEQLEENKNFDETEKKVSDHQGKVKNLQKELERALELNNQLENPLNFDDFSEDFEDVDKSFENSKNELQKRNRKKAGENLRNTSEKLQNMAFGMQQMLDMNTQEQNMENLENLRQILSNLIRLSFSQEEILIDLQQVTGRDPQLIKLNREQRKIYDQSLIVKDSLYALALRTPQISNMINNEILSIELNLKKAGEEMEEGLFPNARMSQQFAITSFNNLALLLNEALENLENMMANAKPGDQQCEKPGSKGGGMNMLKQASENIKQQLEKMIEQMKNGNPQNINRELGKSLMQHEMMQQMLRELMNNGSVGSDARKQLQQIDNLLEQNRKELISKSIDAETIARQNLITTRLLEAEKAELERDMDEKRESETADEFYSNPAKFFEYKENDNFTREFLNRNSYKLNNFYNKKYKNYIENIENKR